MKRSLIDHDAISRKLWQVRYILNANFFNKKCEQDLSNEWEEKTITVVVGHHKSEK